MDTVRVAIVGASGYTGAELIRLLLGHPRAKITALFAKDRLTPRVSSVLPHLTGVLELPVEPFDADKVAERADVAFCALPHGASIEAVRALRERNVRVFDLSADFRLRDPAEYAKWYGAEHAARELLASAVYGLPELNREQLPELNREQLRNAHLVAVPGCYPTASTLPVLPLFASGLARTDDVVIHALSGVSGAGRTPSPSSHFSETGEGVRPYKIAGSHRHTPEIEQTLGDVAKSKITVTFTPTLMPMTRGILSTIYLRPSRAGITVDALVNAARAYFEGSPSVSVLDAGVLPDTLWVRGSNRAHVAYAIDARADRIVAMGTIDNLVKGASGQAVQCMNVALGFDERLGLSQPASWP
jgi:N-acetyl-gamma-glutamyl-phosphate reductase